MNWLLTTTGSGQQEPDDAHLTRVFNPSEQIKKFDKAHVYINKWIEDLNELTYPQAMVDHPFARNRAIETYKIGLENSVMEVA